MLVPKYYEDLKTLSVNAEPLRSYYIPTSKECPVNWIKRGETDRFQLLNGEWNFKFFRSIYDCTETFFSPYYIAWDFDTIPVPSNWNDLGYEIHQYSNTRYPFPFDPPFTPMDNPCGAYICNFDYKKPEGTSKFYINFEGVDSCYYVWVNGKFIGYNQVSHSTGEFDISDVLADGKNTLAVLVLKWCDGSYLEDQDKYRSSGIFRDVYILARPENFIRDYFVHTNLKNAYTAADVEIDLEFAKDTAPVEYVLMDARGNDVCTGTSEGNKIFFEIEDAHLWSAEDPYLYTLLMVTDGELIRERIGLREIYTKDAIVYFNGEKIRFRGANRHDSDPKVGSAVSIDHLLRDMILMKQHNVNAIRTCHYPNAPEMYELCDKYGFYVIDETDLEVHGVVNLYNVNIWDEGVEHPFPPFISDNPDWIQPILDRVQRNVIRDKNRPSVVIWSMGNESGYGCTFEESLKWTKEYDPSRLTHYEGSLHRPRNPIGGKNKYDDLDLRSRMYASITEMHDYLSNNPDKPFIQCEFIHAMGNGPGDIEDYYELEEIYDTFVGGFIWEWCDHGVYMGTTPTGKEKYYYGGDCGEFPHDSNFCMDGMVKPDRTVTTGLLEYKNVHRPMRVFPVDTANGKYILYNRMDFTNLKDYLYIKYELLVDGDVVEYGTINDEDILDVKPREKKEVTLPIKPVEGKCCSVLIKTYLKKTIDLRNPNQELGFDQITLTDMPCSRFTELVEAESNAFPQIKVDEDDRYLRVTGQDFTYIYNKLTGLFDNIVYKNCDFLIRPMEMNIWRAPTDNDRVVKELWFEAGYDRALTRTYGTDYYIDEEGNLKIHTISGMAPIYLQRILDIDSTWTIKPDGTILSDMTVEKDAVMRGVLAPYFKKRVIATNPFDIDEAYLPRLGVRMFLPKSMNRVEYFGYGPYESYIDKKQASYMGHFINSVQGLYEDYIRPQENGSHYNCEYVSVANAFQKLNVYNEEPLSFNASEFTAEELTTKAHNYELEKSGYTVFCVDYRQSGIGSGSCGPQLADKYRLNAEKFHFTMHIKPEVVK